MASVQEMKATVRPKAGKGAARAARYSGKVPGVIYGENKPPVLVLLEHDELRKRIYAGRFLTTLYNLDVEGTTHRVIPRDFQLDAIKDLPMHVDFLRVSEGATIRVNVAVHVLNSDQSPGVKRGGAVNIVTHTVEVMCLAESIPESIDVDISDLDINHSRHLSAVTLPPGVRVIAQGDITLVTVVPPSGYAEEMKAAAEAAAAAVTAAAAAAAAGVAPGAEGAAPGATPAPGAAPGAAPAAGAAGAAAKPDKK
ncbi:MAG TPA: 50S ribosomal protein L25/general stress protein Ctc [Pseudolabrys sp.]|jgi:large subunit ribosomal protein L25|nr:50S ribosomal protein L25/general stress protein Ctc [Pseudolabrys sp.]